MFQNQYKIHLFIYFLILFLLLIFTRIGYWNDTVIAGRWDEITYLLAGREIINGKIPYFDFWEIKTTIAFIPYVIANIFDNEILSIRFLGALSIFISLLIFNYKLIDSVNKNIVFILSITFILINYNDAYQSSGITIFCYPLIFYSIFLVLDLKNKKSFKFLILGFIVGLLCLMRQNFYPIALLNFLIFFIYYDKKFFIKNSLIYSFGGFFAITLFILPYIFIEDGILTVYESLILNAIAAGGYIDFLWNFREIIRFLMDDHLGVLFLISIVFGFYKCLDKEKDKLRIVFILFIGYFFSIFLAFTGQYQLNNLIPSILIILAYILNDLKIKNIFKNKEIDLLKSKFFLILFISIITVPVILNSTIKIIKSNNFFLSTNSKYLSYNFSKNDKNIQSTKNMKKYILEEDTIFSYDNFYYLLLNKNLLTNILHPSIFFRLGIYKNIRNVANSTDQEFLNILSKNPKWLIIRKKAYEEKFSKKVKSKIEGDWMLFDEQDAYHKQIIFKLKN